MYILPTVRINTGQYRGKLSYREVLRAICSGFNRHNEPAACNRVGEDDCRVGAAGQRDCAAQCAADRPSHVAPTLPLSKYHLLRDVVSANVTLHCDLCHACMECCREQNDQHSSGTICIIPLTLRQTFRHS